MKSFIASLLLSSLVSLGRADYLTLTGDPLRHGHIPDAGLDPSVVSSNSFGRIFPTSNTNTGYVDLPIVNGVPPGTSYAAPLVYTHPTYANPVVFVATENNNIYSIDGITGAVLASRNVNTPFNRARDLDCGDIIGNVGITGTPVIDAATGTAFFYSKTYSDVKVFPDGQQSGYLNGRYKFHAVDVLTLAERPGFPVDPQDSVAENDQRKLFHGGKQLQRPGLHLHDGVVYGAFGAHCDNFNFTGWLIGYEATTGRQVTVWATDSAAPANGVGGAGIWMSGNAIAADGQRLYIVTGNGPQSVTKSSTPGAKVPISVPMAAVALDIDPVTKKVSPVDFFQPYDYEAQNGGDRDFGSGGMTLFPYGSTSPFKTTTAQKLAAAVGKTGTVYVFNAEKLGGFAMGNRGQDDVLAEIQLPSSVYGQVAVFPGNGGYMYANAANNPVQALKFFPNDDKAGFVVTGQSPFPSKQYAGSPIVTSLNGQDDTGLVWVADYSGTLTAFHAVPQGGNMVVAFSDSLEGLYPIEKFVRPAFHKGKVYVVSSSGRLYAYGSPTNFALTSPEVQYGTVILGQPVTIAVNFTVQVEGIIVQGAKLDAPEFQFTLPAPVLPTKALTKGSTYSIQVTFTPPEVGFYHAQLTLTTSNGPKALAFATLRGLAKSLTPKLVLQPLAINFGGGVTNVTSVTTNALVSNGGVQPLTILGYRLPSVDGAFAVLNPPAVGTVIASGDSLTLSVVFRPRVDGVWNETLIVNSDGGDNYILLSGVSAGPPHIKIEVQYLDGTKTTNVSDVEFGTITETNKKTIPVLVTNTGFSPLTLSKLKLPNSDENPIRSDIFLGEATKVAPNETKIIPISFTHPFITTPYVQQFSKTAVDASAIVVLNSDDPDATEAVFVRYFGSVLYTPLNVAELTAKGEDWTYSDCYVDPPATRALPFGVTTAANSLIMTPDVCVKACSAGGYPVAGIEFGQECWCGKSLPSFGVSGVCTIACKGDARYACGGGGALTVYYDAKRVGGTAPPPPPVVVPAPYAPEGWSYVGCAVDNPKVVTVQGPGSAYDSGLCTAYCQGVNKNYIFAGLEYGGECWCGSTVNFVAAPETDCNIPCSVNGTQLCGNGGRLSLYNLTSIPLPVTTTTTPGPTPTPTGPAPYAPEGWSYVGCTVDNPRALSNQAPGSNYDSGLCTAYCQGLNKANVFAGLEYGGECWCGSTITRVAAPETDCLSTCNVNQTQLCGSGGHLSLFTLTALPPAPTTTDVVTTPSPTPTPTPTGPAPYAPEGWSY
ncbi:hypothetical protein HDU97_004598, partial [Phlyctochytrium planicorne]